MMKRLLPWLAVLLLLVIGGVAVGCGSSDSGATTATVSEAAIGDTSKDRQEATTNSGGENAKQQDAGPTGPTTAECSLKGKAKANVVLEYTADEGFDLTFEGQPVPSTGTVLYSATVFDKTGEYGDQLGLKYLDGEQIAYFVFPLDESSGQVNLDGEATVNGDTVSATFPAEDLGPLADAGPATWSAAFNVEGNDVGGCPGGIHSLPFPAP